jgi:glycosyltransferase involved in cell wall biosynthesis
MFSCGEYTLCGIPVVNTQNLGGRDTLLPDFAVKFAEDTPESVAQAVEYWVNNPIEPEEIRLAFLEKAQEQKALVQNLINDIAKKEVYLPHKLNIRCKLLPHTKFFHGIKKVN